MTESEPHVEALLSLLESQVPSVLQVGLTTAPDNVEPPYLVLHPDPGDVNHARLCGTEELRMFFIVHGVGHGPLQSLWAADQARQVVLSNKPAVSGRHVYPIEQTGQAGSVQTELDVNPPLFSSAVEFLLWTVPI